MLSTAISALKLNRSTRAGDGLLRSLRGSRGNRPEPSDPTASSNGNGRSHYSVSGSENNGNQAPAGAASILQIGPDGAARCRVSDEWPHTVLFALDNSFDCEEAILTGLSAIPRRNLDVHLLWVAKQPTWVSRSFNRNLLLQNLQHSRQRAAAELEKLVNVLEAEGYRATWEADEISEPRAERIARAAREIDADLVLVPNTLEPALGMGRWQIFRKQDDVIDRPIMTIGPGPQVAELNHTDIPATVQSGKRLDGGIPPPRRPEQRDAPARESVPGRSRNS